MCPLPTSSAVKYVLLSKMMLHGILCQWIKCFVNPSMVVHAEHLMVAKKGFFFFTEYVCFSQVNHSQPSESLSSREEVHCGKLAFKGMVGFFGERPCIRESLFHYIYYHGATWHPSSELTYIPWVL